MTQKFTMRESSGAIWLRLRSTWRGVYSSASSRGSREESEILHRVTNDLRSLNELTERDFLAVGAQLHEFAGESRAISTCLEGLISVLSGEQGERLQSLLRSLSTRCESMLNRATQTASGLRVLSAESTSARDACSAIIDTIRTFRVIGTMTRIEISLLCRTGADFSFLTKEVEHLTLSIEENVQRVIEVNSTLAPHIDQALKRVAELGAREMQSLPQVIEGIVAGISSLNDRRAAARGSFDKLATEYKRLTAAIEELVVSLQAQDITRQQLEHIIEALEHVCDQRTETDDDSFRAILTLQTSQLLRAEDTFTESLRRVATSLGEIERRIRSMSSEINGLFGVTSTDGTPFFLQLEQALQAALKSSDACSDAENAPSHITVDLEKAVLAMQEPIEQIGLIEIQMQRIALNTQVGASHLGVIGEPLACLAAAIQEIAAECRKNYVRAGDALVNMRRGASDLASYRNEREQQDGQGSIFDEVRLAAEKMHSSSEASFSGIEQVNLRCVLLSERLTETAKIQAGQTFAEIAGRCRTALISLGAAGNPEVGDLMSGNLAHFTGRYTMQAERDVHAAIVDSAGSNRPAEPIAEVVMQSLEADNDETLGSNVEMF